MMTVIAATIVRVIRRHFRRLTLTPRQTFVLAAVLAVALSLIAPLAGAPAHEAVVPTGLRAWTSFGSDRLFISDLSGRNRWSPGRGQPVAWSPDGTRLLLSRTRQRSELVLVDVPRKTSRLLFAARRGRNVGWAFWSRDGTRVLFSQAHDVVAAKCDAWLLVASTDGSGVRTVDTSTRPRALLGWSPDERSALVLEAPTCAGTDFPYAGGRPSGDRLLSVSLEGGRPMALARNVVKVGEPAILDAAWSPDGGLVAYTKCHRLPGGSATCGVWIVGSRGGRPRLLVPQDDPGLVDDTVLWSPNGREIFYGRGSHLVGRDYSHALVGKNVQTGYVRRIAKAAFPYAPAIGRRATYRVPNL
jgi:hypothetical protein